MTAWFLLIVGAWFAMAAAFTVLWARVHAALRGDPIDEAAADAAFWERLEADMRGETDDRPA